MVDSRKDQCLELFSAGLERHDIKQLLRDEHGIGKVKVTQAASGGATKHSDKGVLVDDNAAVESEMREIGLGEMVQGKAEIALELSAGEADALERGAGFENGVERREIDTRTGERKTNRAESMTGIAEDGGNGGNGENVFRSVEDAESRGEAGKVESMKTGD